MWSATDLTLEVSWSNLGTRIMSSFLFTIGVSSGTLTREPMATTYVSAPIVLRGCTACANGLPPLDPWPAVKSTTIFLTSGDLLSKVTEAYSNARSILRNPRRRVRPSRLLPRESGVFNIPSLKAILGWEAYATIATRDPCGARLRAADKYLINTFSFLKLSADTP